VSTYFLEDLLEVVQEGLLLGLLAKNVGHLALEVRKDANVYLD
jgi:hypothetical protein